MMADHGIMGGVYPVTPQLIGALGTPLMGVKPLVQGTLAGILPVPLGLLSAGNITNYRIAGTLPSAPSYTPPITGQLWPRGDLDAI